MVNFPIFNFASTRLTVNKQKFVELLKNPSNPQAESLADLDEMVKTYPYFQSARVLSAKIASQLKDKAAKRRIGAAAVYATDRALLKKYITGKLFFVGGETKLEESSKREIEKKVSPPPTPQQKPAPTPEPKPVQEEKAKKEEVAKKTEPEKKAETASKVEPVKKTDPTKKVEAASKAEAIKKEPPPKEVQPAQKAPVAKPQASEDLPTEELTPSEEYSTELDDLIVQIHRDMAELRKNKARFDSWMEKNEEDEAVSEAIKKAGKSSETTPKTEDTSTTKKASTAKKTAAAKPTKAATAKTTTTKSAKKAITGKPATAKTTAAKSATKASAAKSTPKKTSTPKSTTKTAATKSTAAKKTAATKKTTAKKTTAASKSATTTSKSTKTSRTSSKTSKPKKEEAKKKSTQAVKATKTTEKPASQAKSKTSPTTKKETKAAKPTTGSKKSAQKEIIDEFIEKKPSISRKTKEASGDKEDLANKSTRFHVDIASEYLAEIYISQGKNDRAIEIYENLSLKFPEKEAYFAGLIKDLKKK